MKYTLTHSLRAMLLTVILMSVGQRVSAQPRPPIPIAVRGARATDVFQGSGGNCTVLSGIAAAARSGIDFTKRIRYLGKNRYPVGMFNAKRQYKLYLVYFDGSRLAVDANFNPRGPKESWVILVNRAYFLSRGYKWTSPPNGRWAWQVLPAFTGGATKSFWRAAAWVAPEAKNVGKVFGNDDLNRLRLATKTRRPVTAGIPPESAKQDKRLIGGHTYTVMGTYTRNVRMGKGQYKSVHWVVLRNPWGRDGGRIASGDPNDGLITLSWNDFRRLIGGYTIG